MITSLSGCCHVDQQVSRCLKYAYKHVFPCIEHFEHTAQSEQVLAWIEYGFLLSFVPVDSACQLVHPGCKEKVFSVTQLLQNTVSKEQVPALLTVVIHLKFILPIGMCFPVCLPILPKLILLNALSWLLQS